MQGGKAKIGQTEAETGKIKAETNSIERDYKTRISTLEENNKQMQALINDLQQQLGIKVRQQGQQQGGGLDSELGGVNQNQLTPQANPQPSVQMPQAQQANPQRMAQMPSYMQQSRNLTGDEVNQVRGVISGSGGIDTTQNPNGMRYMEPQQGQANQSQIQQLDAQAASIQQQFKSGRISREQAAAQLRALGYED